VRTLAPPVATGLLTGCGCAVTACRLSHLGTALDILSPGASARDPGMVSPSANRGRRVTTRAIKSVNADLALNRQLWALAETFSQN